MKRYLIILSFLFLSLTGYSQHKVLIGGGLDVIKSDNSGLFKKFQMGLELNYFITKKVTFGGGLEAWSAPQTTFIVLGTRFYPVKPLFLRFRGLIAGNSEIALGAGYTVPITRKLVSEFCGDYYFDSKELGLRAGLALRF